MTRPVITQIASVLDVTKDRHLYVGASETAAALNMGRFERRADVWLRKGKKAADAALMEPNSAMHWGTILEAPIRIETEAVTKLEIEWPVPIAVHPQLKVLRAHPDGLTSDGRIFEAKTARTAENWGDAGSTEIPHEYLIQVQVQMACCRLPAALVAVLIAGSDFRLYEIKADEEVQEFIVAGVRDFWKFVIDDVCPPVDYSAPGALAFIKKRYPGTTGEIRQADERCLRSRFEIESCKEQLAALGESRDASLAQLLDFLGDGALLQFPDGKSLRRQLVQRKAYEVKATEFIQARWVTQP
jgi:putative phage-type endonuclease